MSKTLCIPDVHLKLERVERILCEEGYDRVVFLGDFFDDFDDTPSMNAKMTQQLNEWMRESNFDFVCGNHDAHYFWDIPNIRCSGHEYIKSLAINNFLDRDLMLSKFKFFHLVDGWLLTHAGLHKGWVPTPNEGRELGDVVEFLVMEQEKCFNQFRKGFCEHWFFAAGQSRGGRAPFGGIEWCDANREFAPIEGVRQVFGHTPQRYAPKWIGDSNLCLDTNLNHYVIIKDGKVEVKSYINLV